VDRTTVEYWTRFWQGAKPPRQICVDGTALGHTVDRAYHAALERYVPADRGARLIEIGCGNSAWLPFFSRRFGIGIAGLDYSEYGCARARTFLEMSKVDGDVRCGDFRNPPEDWKEAFDVVFTNGLVEHFDDTSAALSQIARFAKPGGKLLTFIPNMYGLNGWLQKRLGPQTFATHRRLDDMSLRSAHEQAGLSILECRFLLPTNLLVVNPDARGASARLFTTAARVLTAAVWSLDRFVSLPRTRAAAPYVFCCAEKP